MSAIDFSDVKVGTYVSIDGVQCKELTLDGNKVWEYKAPLTPYYYMPSKSVPSNAQVTMTYVTSTSFKEYTLDNVGEVESYIKAGGSYAYPIGSNKITLRDGSDYFLTMSMGFNDVSQGATYTNVFPVKLKFQRAYKEAIIYMSSWFTTWKSLDVLKMTITVGNDVKEFDLTEEIDDAIHFYPTTEFDSITFSFEFSNNSYVAQRSLDSMTIAVDSIACFA